MNARTMLTAVALHFWLLSISASSLQALDDIGYETWDSAQFVGGIAIAVKFDARFTETDLNEGVTYSIVQLGIDGTPAVTLLRFVVDEFPDLPPAGTPVLVNAFFRVVCDPNGQLAAESSYTTIIYCHPDGENRVLQLPGVGHGFTNPSDEAEFFNLAVVDEHQARGPESPSVNEYACVDGRLIGTSTAQKAARYTPSSVRTGTGTIGIYFDRQGTQCAGTVPKGVPTTVYVLARLSGRADCGISGAEFRFGGVPEGWQTFTVAENDAVMIGDPFGDGVAVAFPCESPADKLVPLFTVQVIATDTQSDFQFTIEERNPPSAPEFPRPQLILCDALFSKEKVEGIPCWVNPSAAKECMTVAVEEATWSAVKSLFRD